MEAKTGMMYLSLTSLLLIALRVIFGQTLLAIYFVHCLNTVLVDIDKVYTGSWGFIILSSVFAVCFLSNICGSNFVQGNAEKESDKP